MYLFIAAVVGMVMLTVPLATGCDDVGDIDLIMFYPALILLCISCFFSLVTIGLYKNRRLQMKICIVTMILFFSTFISTSYLTAALGCTVGFGSVVPLLSAVLALLAWNGIKKDEKLVRSADRLR